MVSGGSYRVRILNSGGTLVFDQTWASQPAGSCQAAISLSGFAPGIYYYQLQLNYDDGSSESQPAKTLVIVP
jgi:hypothetical protein